MLDGHQPYKTVSRFTSARPTNSSRHSMPCPVRQTCTSGLPDSLVCAPPRAPCRSSSTSTSSCRSTGHQAAATAATAGAAPAAPAAAWRSSTPGGAAKRDQPPGRRSCSRAVQCQQAAAGVQPGADAGVEQQGAGRAAQGLWAQGGGQEGGPGAAPDGAPAARAQGGIRRRSSRGAEDGWCSQDVRVCGRSFLFLCRVGWVLISFARVYTSDGDQCACLAFWVSFKSRLRGKAAGLLQPARQGLRAGPGTVCAA